MPRYMGAAAQLLFVVISLACAGEDIAGCGYQCTSDADCTGCGEHGKCSKPYGNDTVLASLTATCIDASGQPPVDPKPDVGASTTAPQFFADVSLVSYGDYSDDPKTGQGNVYYDATHSQLAHEWTDYLGQGKQRQVWYNDSSYYIQLRFGLCIHFQMKDSDGALVGTPLTSWMQMCSRKTESLVYVGREKVGADWSDHYACYITINDSKHGNVTIAFQNWHSIGLGASPLGTPLRITGSNSRPQSVPPTARLTTVFYSNYSTDPTPASTFARPKLCLPVGVTEQLSEADLKMSQRKVPRSRLTATSVKAAMMKLNTHLNKEARLVTRECESFSLVELQELQRALFHVRSHLLQHNYSIGDRRLSQIDTIHNLVSSHRQQVKVAEMQPELRSMVRDGLCLESIMMFVHHLSSAAREQIKQLMQLPLLPQVELHSLSSLGSKLPASHSVTEAHSVYVKQASCAVCHVAPSHR